MLQYELADRRADGGRRPYWQLLLLLTLVLGAAAFYAFSTATTAADNIGGAIWGSLYYPTLALQLVTLIVAFRLGAATVDAERSRKTWDSLRVTEEGARLALRARWIGIMYRLRAPILAIIMLRLLLTGIMLTELTAFGGRLAHIISGNATPPLPDWRLGLSLIALHMALNLLLPLVMLAATAALGIVLSAAIKERVYALIIQIVLVLAQLAFTAAAALLIAADLSASVKLADPARFLLYIAYSGWGDWGLLHAHLGSVGEIWRRVPHGAAIALGAAIQLLLLSAAADGLIALAARLSERRG